jgi:hypothetical protein
MVIVWRSRWLASVAERLRVLSFGVSFCAPEWELQSPLVGFALSRPVPVVVVGSEAATNVFLRCDHLEVLRVAAVSVATQVIGLFSGRNFAAFDGVGSTVSFDEWSVVWCSYVAVSVGIFGSLPSPARSTGDGVREEVYIDFTI